MSYEIIGKIICMTCGSDTDLLSVRNDYGTKFNMCNACIELENKETEIGLTKSEIDYLTDLLRNELDDISEDVKRDTHLIKKISNILDKLNIE